MTIETGRPADVALLRSLASGFDSGEYQSSSNDPNVVDIAARLRALADALEEITPERLWLVRQQFVGSTNQLIPADLDAYDALCKLERAVNALRGA